MIFPVAPVFIIRIYCVLYSVPRYDTYFIRILYVFRIYIVAKSESESE